MHDLMQIFKRAALEAYESERMTDLVFGTVDGIRPLTVTIDGEHAVNLLRRAGEPELKAGDLVYLIRLRGGQKFLLLDKVVGA